MVQPFWKTVWWFLKKLKTELLYDPAIPLLGIYPKELKAGTGRVICTPMFTAALFAIAKKWKQPKHLLMDEWINKMWCVHTVEYYSALKRKENLTHAATQISLRIC